MVDYFCKFFQGDLTYIVVENNNIVAHYDYDAYGNQRIYGYHDNQWLLLEDTLTHEGIYSNATLPLQLPYLLSDKDTLKNNHIAYINPFRYRSYYYDMETNLYYLTTRYYDPETGRFINADSLENMKLQITVPNGLNLFAFCLNNPINNSDPTGGFVLSLAALILIGFGVGAAVGTGISIVSQGIANGWNNINWWQVGLDAVLGGVGGALAMSGLGTLALGLAGAGLGFIGSLGAHLLNGNDLSNWKTWRRI